MVGELAHSSILLCLSLKKKRHCTGFPLKKKLRRDETRTQVAIGVWSRHVIYKPSDTHSQKHLKPNNVFFVELKGFIYVHYVYR